jgi:hypothetical protein
VRLLDSQRARDEAAKRLLSLATSVRGRNACVSFLELSWLSRIASSRDALSDWQLARSQPARSTLKFQRVREVVRQAERNSYTIGTAALEFLDSRVAQSRPRAILEFGSGVSTVVLAARVASIYGEDRLRVFSIDESDTYLHETWQMLDAAGLAESAGLAHRRVRDQVVCGRRTQCYDLDPDFLTAFLQTTPDFLLIDGPSGGGNRRFGTLPLVVDHVARPCTFFLDDALRGDEIAVASLWQKVMGAELGCAHLVGHGLLEGRLVG